MQEQRHEVPVGDDQGHRMPSFEDVFQRGLAAVEHLGSRLASWSVQVGIVEGTPNDLSPICDRFRRQDAFIEAVVLVDR